MDTLEKSLDLSETNDAAQVPKAIVKNVGGTTQVQLPLPVFERSQNEADGRTFNFFAAPGMLHEGQLVIIFSYGEHQELSARGTVQRAQAGPENTKWFVQTKPRAA